MPFNVQAEEINFSHIDRQQNCSQGHAMDVEKFRVRFSSFRVFFWCDFAQTERVFCKCHLCNKFDYKETCLTK